MLRKRMKKAKLDLSIPGFGCTRLPVTTEGKIDESQAAEIILQLEAECLGIVV